MSLGDGGRAARLPDLRPQVPALASASAPTARCRSSTSAAASEEPITEAHERARKVKPQYTGGELSRSAFARNLAEAELIQGILLEEGIPSVQRRTRGFDVPDFLAAGPRDILVPQAGAEAARELLADTGEHRIADAGRRRRAPAAAAGRDPRRARDRRAGVVWVLLASWSAEPSRATANGSSSASSSSEPARGSSSRR